MEFTPINTQEEFDAAVAEKYGDISGLQQQIDTLTGERDAHAATITELQGKVKGYETSALRQKIAREKGIPVELADRLTGDTEKDIRTDADAMKVTLETFKGPAPRYDPESGKGGSAKDANLTNMLHELRGE